MSQPLLIVIISNFNGLSILHKQEAVLRLCVDSIFNNIDYENFKVILADDCSCDASIEFIKSGYPFIEVVKTSKRGGFAINNNNAIKFARSKYNPAYILLLNNDIIINDKNCFRDLIKYAEEDSRVGISGVKLVYPGGKIQNAGLEAGLITRSIGRAELDNGQYDRLRDEADAVSGAFFLIKKAVLDSVGLLDENLYMGHEDIDYCLRARKCGFRILYNGLIKVVHLEGFSSTCAASKEFSDERFSRNQINNIYFAFKHYRNPGMRLLAFLYNLAGAVFSIEDRERVRSFVNMKIKDRLVWRIYVTIRSFLRGYILYRDSIRL